MKNISILILIIIFFLPIKNLFGQSAQRNTRVTLSGKIITGGSGLPLHLASIYLPDLKTGTITDENGNYVISNISPGKYLVEVSFVGFTSIVETIDITESLKRDFTLSASLIENETVTITGVSSATSTKRTPVPVDIIKRENLFNNVATNLIDN